MEILTKAAEIMKSIPNVTIALIDLDGYPSASTISSMKTDGIQTVWFATGTNGDKAERIRQCDHASVCYTNGKDNVTLVGTVEILTDAQIKSELWVDWFIDHFQGVDDPNYCILKFTTQRVNLWIDQQSMKGALRGDGM